MNTVINNPFLHVQSKGTTWFYGKYTDYTKTLHSTACMAFTERGLLTCARACVCVLGG